VEIVTIPTSEISLAQAVRSYLFNAQLVTLSTGEMALVVPMEAWGSAPVRQWLDAMTAGNGPIRRVVPVDVRQSMANGGGPACLRLRVVAEVAEIDPRFLLDEAKADRIEEVIAQIWPETLEPHQLGDERLARQVREARAALLEAVDLGELA
jgi:succinylarginine dihydrolase